MNRGASRYGRFAVLTFLLVAGAMAVIPLATARAQTETDVRSLEIERQLLCPQCTNLRLDVCETQICIDMRAVIRERIAQGQSDQEIIEYFTGRYGDRVLADVPREGFNLWLFGWVGGSMLLVAALGTYVLLRLRRTASPASIAGDGDEQWLEAEQARERDRARDG